MVKFGACDKDHKVLMSCVKRMVANSSKKWRQKERIELCLGANEERVESLWVRIKGQAHMSDTVVGVYYRPPDQEEEVDEAFYSQLNVASQSQSPVLIGDFNHPDICWEDHTARHTQSRRFLQSIGN